MRAKIAAFWILGAIAPGAFAQPMLPFPADIDGIDRLRAWLVERRLELPTIDQLLTIDEGTAILVVYHASGSGLPQVDAYVYACDRDHCSIVALRRSIPLPRQKSRGVRAEFNQARSELYLRSPDGIVLRVPLKKPAESQAKRE